MIKPMANTSGFRCELCNIWLNNRDALRKHKFTEHLKAHHKSLGMKQGTLPASLWKYKSVVKMDSENQLWCTICNIFCNTAESFLFHVKGKQHVRKSSLPVASLNSFDRNQPPAAASSSSRSRVCNEKTKSIRDNERDLDGRRKCVEKKLTDSQLEDDILELIRREVPQAVAEFGNTSDSAYRNGSLNLEPTIEKVDDLLASMQYLKQLYLMGLSDGLKDLELEKAASSSSKIQKENNSQPAETTDCPGDIKPLNQLVNELPAPVSNILDIISVSPASYIRKKMSAAATARTATTILNPPIDFDSDRENMPAVVEIGRKKQNPLLQKRKLVEVNESVPPSVKIAKEDVPSLDDKICDHQTTEQHSSSHSNPSPSAAILSNLSIKLSPLLSRKIEKPSINPCNSDILSKVSSILNDIAQIVIPVTNDVKKIDKETPPTNATTKLLQIENSLEATKDCASLSGQQYSSLSVDTALGCHSHPKSSTLSGDRMTSLNWCESSNSSDNLCITPNPQFISSPASIHSATDESKARSPASIYGYIESVTGLKLQNVPLLTGRRRHEMHKKPIYDNASYRLLALDFTITVRTCQNAETIDWECGFHGRHIIRDAANVRRIPHLPLYLSRPVKSNNMPEVVPTDARLDANISSVIYNRPLSLQLDKVTPTTVGNSNFPLSPHLKEIDQDSTITSSACDSK